MRDETYRFDGFVLRPAREEDRALAEAWTKADPAHRKTTTANFWIEGGKLVECWLLWQENPLPPEIGDRDAVLKINPEALAHWIPWDESEPFGICQIYLDDKGSKAFADGDTEEEAWREARKKLERPIFFFRIESATLARGGVPTHAATLSKAAVLHIQFAPEGGISRLVTMQALSKGWLWLKEILARRGYEAVYFTSRNQPLIEFCTSRRMGFEPCGLRDGEMQLRAMVKTKEV